MLTALRADRLLTLRVPLRQPGLWVPKGVLPAMLSAFFGASLSRVCALSGMVLGSFARRAWRRLWRFGWPRPRSWH